MEGDEVNPVARLTEGQRARIERNREKARTLREARRASHPYDRGSVNSTASVHPKVAEDTHGGFLLEEEEEKTTRAPTYKIAEDNGAFVYAQVRAPASIYIPPPPQFPHYQINC